MLRNGSTRFLSLRYKFIILFCLLITIPFLISGFVTYSKYSSDVERNARSYTTQIMDQININLDRYVKEMERLTLTPFYDEDIIRILNNHDGQPQSPKYLTTDEAVKMNLFISSLSFDRTEIKGMMIFANDGRLFSNLDSIADSYYGLQELDWMQEVRLERGGLTIVPPHKGTYYKEDTEQLVSVARMIREPYSHKVLGMVKVDLTPEGFRKILFPVELSENSKLYIMDAQERLIYSTLESDLPPLEGADIVIGESEFLRAHVTSDYTGLQVVGLIPRNDLRKEARELIQFTLIISLLSLTFAYVLAVVSSSRLVKPIRHLQSKMKLVQKGSLNERAQITTNDEIGQLTFVFNRMIEEINHLVKEVYETSLREKEAELSALQSQINPHFLYNTLETMNMLAIQQQNYELSNMTTSLGKLLRYTVDKQEKPVCLKDELHFVEAYLQIQSFRLGQRLKTEIRVDASFENCLVPKLILQPLVENVIEHGLGTLPQVKVLLYAIAREDDLVLIVEDTGQGMNEEKIKQLEQQISVSMLAGLAADDEGKLGFDKVKKGYALRNVHQRIRLLYGESYGLFINKSMATGTQFSIVLPLKWEG